MVYLYKKTVGSKSYYYLRISKRKNNKIIVKDVVYLGNSIEEVKKSLGKFPKYKEEIKKAYKSINHFLEYNHYLEKAKSMKIKKDQFLKENLEKIEACKLHFRDKFEKMDSLTKKEILKNFIIEFAFNTTSIEGNTINLEEARNLLNENLTPKNKTLREIYDIQNTEEVLLELFNNKKDISNDVIINIHKKLMKNIDFRVNYRDTDVRVIKANFKATPAPYVKTDMDLLIKWYDKNKKILHPFVLAILLHHKFEKIHPFMDGNGRTGRMLLNLILLKNNYPPLIIHKKQRIEYLENLRKADKSDSNSVNVEDYTNLINFIAEEMESTYWNIFL